MNTDYATRSQATLAGSPTQAPLPEIQGRLNDLDALLSAMEGYRHRLTDAYCRVIAPKPVAEAPTAPGPNTPIPQNVNLRLNSLIARLEHECGRLNDLADAFDKAV